MQNCMVTFENVLLGVMGIGILVGLAGGFFLIIVVFQMGSPRMTHFCKLLMQLRNKYDLNLLPCLKWTEVTSRIQWSVLRGYMMSWRLFGCIFFVSTFPRSALKSTN